MAKEILKSSMNKKDAAATAILTAEFALMQHLHRACAVYIRLDDQRILTFYDGDIGEMRDAMEDSAILLWQDILQDDEHRSAVEIRAMMQGVRNESDQSFIHRYLTINFYSQIEWRLSIEKEAE